MKILIAGSMESTLEMMLYAWRCVERAQEKGYLIIVGDTTNGIDKTVVTQCLKNEVAFSCYGIAKAPRNKAVPWQSYYQVPIVTGRTGFAAFHQRDQVMIKTADLGVFIWNGKSRGTKVGYEYMKKLGKDAYLKQP